MSLDKSPATITAVILMWVVFSITGFSFLKNAVMEETPKRSSKVRLILGEVRFRVRLFMGILLLLWVAVSLVWVLIKWL
jgi:hypothetical protein